MATYFMLTRLGPGVMKDPKDFKEIALAVRENIRKSCPGLIAKDAYICCGRYDVIDIFETDDPEQLQKAAMIIRSYGCSTTETILATHAKEFVDSL